jgi:crossover junction endodeoxyribonuclease RuvC
MLTSSEIREDYHANNTQSAAYRRPIVCGIDPGLDGALAALSVNDVAMVSAVVMPVIGKKGKGKRILDNKAIANWFRNMNRTYEIRSVFLEAVHSMPGQGVVSTGSLMRGFGSIEGILDTLDLPWSAVPPQTWKKVVLVGTKKDKAAAIAHVRRNYDRLDSSIMYATLQSRTYHDGIADALCIADYGRRIYNVRTTAEEAAAEGDLP